MADYYTQTVVRPSIPAAAITPLEMDLLLQMFEHEPDGDAVYFFASDGVCDTVWLAPATLKASLAIASDTPSAAADFVRKELASADADADEIELDLSDLQDAVFQDVIRRSDLIDSVVITSAWTCSKMRPDGFGGSVTVITADRVFWSSTTEMECELLDRAQYGDLGCAPGHGSHVLLRLDEADVRRTVEEIAEGQAPKGVALEDVTDDDIRAAARAVQASTDLSRERGQIAFNAALAALHLAAGRHETAQP
ncbi:hypothetical protein [Sphingobium sp. B2]|uniref:hypothetical protein n=1 Tax=Sphingobium sp. B2 TaxID=2583228 RepID=UPI0011AAC006|nr:hypothetical protein [Sphingobium sp. B2]